MKEEKIWRLNHLNVPLALASIGSKTSVLFVCCDRCKIFFLYTYISVPLRQFPVDTLCGFLVLSQKISQGEDSLSVLWLDHLCRQRTKT